MPEWILVVWYCKWVSSQINLSSPAQLSEGPGGCTSGDRLHHFTCPPAARLMGPLVLFCRKLIIPPPTRTGKCKERQSQHIQKFTGSTIRVEPGCLSPLLHQNDSMTFHFKSLFLLEDSNLQYRVSLPFMLKGWDLSEDLKHQWLLGSVNP